MLEMIIGCFRSNGDAVSRIDKYLDILKDSNLKPNTQGHESTPIILVFVAAHSCDKKGLNTVCFRGQLKIKRRICFQEGNLIEELFCQGNGYLIQEPPTAAAKSI